MPSFGMVHLKYVLHNPQQNETLNVKHIMDTWTVQDGFPYVNISIVTSETGLSNFTIQQKRFLSNPNAVFNQSSSPFG